MTWKTSSGTFICPAVGHCFHSFFNIQMQCYWSQIVIWWMFCCLQWFVFNFVLFSSELCGILHADSSCRKKAKISPSSTSNESGWYLSPIFLLFRRIFSKCSLYVHFESFLHILNTFHWILASVPLLDKKKFLSFFLTFAPTAKTWFSCRKCQNFSSAKL